MVEMSSFVWIVAGTAILFLFLIQYKFWGRQAGVIGVGLGIVMLVVFWWIFTKLGFF